MALDRSGDTHLALADLKIINDFLHTVYPRSELFGSGSLLGTFDGSVQCHYSVGRVDIDPRKVRRFVRDQRGIYRSGQRGVIDVSPSRAPGGRLAGREEQG